MRTAHKATAAVLVAAGVMYVGYEGTGPVFRAKDGTVMVRSYDDGVGVPTICFGETRSERPGLRLGEIDTLDNCKARLPMVLKKYDDGITACLHRDLPDGVHVVFIQMSANIGIAGFCHSAMAARSDAGDFVGACHALRAWRMAGGKPILDRRRRLEERDCLNGITGAIPPLRYPPPLEPTVTANKEPTTPWKAQPPPSTSLPPLVSSPSSASSGSTASAPSATSTAPSQPEAWPKRVLHWLLKSQ